MRNRAIRRHNRHTKAMRRIREDVAEHGADISCPCFDARKKQKGQTFSRFADHPKLCSGPCCGNPRKHFGDVTYQEKRAPSIKDWD